MEDRDSVLAAHDVIETLGKAANVARDNRGVLFVRDVVIRVVGDAVLAVGPLRARVLGLAHAAGMEVLGWKVQVVVAGFVMIVATIVRLSGRIVRVDVVVTGVGVVARGGWLEVRVRVVGLVRSGSIAVDAMSCLQPKGT